MTQADPALLHLLGQSMLLPERLAEAVGIDAPCDAGPDARRLERWQHLLGGQAAALNKRIESAGWSRAAVDAVMSRQCPRFARPPLDQRQRPPWLELLERVLATPPPRDMAPRLSSLPFGELYGGFVAVGRGAVSERLAQRASALADRVLPALELVLAESISEILSRCLFAEFDAGRPPATALVAALIGDSDGAFGDRYYRAFVERQRADNLRGMLMRYPVAARLSAMRLMMWIDASAQFIRRLIDDLPEIRRRIPGADRGGPADVAGIAGRLGDLHEYGRSVMVVTFADHGKVVYKPRSLAAEAAWRSFVVAVDPAFATLAATVMDRGGYGWMEHVARRDLPDRDAARSFYRSVGALLCLARTLGLDDLHFENVVAAGEALVPVDLETIAQPRLPSAPATTLERLAAARESVLEESVRETRGLPARDSLSNLPPLDISALADLRAETRRRPVWRHLANDGIARVFQDEPFAAANLPRLNGGAIPPDEYREEIVHGFEAAWDGVARVRDRLAVTGGPLDALAAVPVRFVYRPTEVYRRLLDRALDPQAMRCGIDFSIELEALYRAVCTGDLPDALRAVVEAELQALYRADIPRFTTTAGGRAVFADGALRCDDAFARSGLETVRARLANMTPEQRGAEVRFIRASLQAARRSPSPEVADRPAADSRSPLSRQEALAAAIDIGREVVRTLVARSDGGASWIGVACRQEAAGPAAVIVDESIYEGATGIGIFLSALYRITGEERWREPAERAFVDARRLACEAVPDERIAAALGLGLKGIGGLVYGLTVAGDLLDDRSLVVDAIGLAAAIDRAAICETEGIDVLTGLAGAIPGLLAAADVEAGAGTGDVALACGRAILARAGGSLGSCGLPNEPDGFRHGAAGILATLALLADRDAAIRRAVEGALAHDGGTLPQPRSPAGLATPGPSGRCNGSIGASAARLAAQFRLGRCGDEAAVAVERAVDEASVDPGVPDQACCGLFGGVEALLIAGARVRPALRDKARRLAGAVLDRARRDGGFRLLAGMPPTFASPGFFQGISGIGYTLLRIARPGALPSVLLMEWRP